MSCRCLQRLFQEVISTTNNKEIYLSITLKLLPSSSLGPTTCVTTLTGLILINASVTDPFK